MNEIPIWALAIDPVDPNIIFAGTRPAALFRSTDGGQHWDKLLVQIADERPNVGIPRVPWWSTRSTASTSGPASK